MRISRIRPKIPIGLAVPRATVPGMSAQMYAIIGVGVALAALVQRVARLEGVIPGPRDFARDSGAGNTA